MFIKDLDPSPGMFFDARQFQYCPSPETSSAFRFSVAKPCLFSKECCMDRYYVYSPTQDPPQSFNPQMEKMNHVSRAAVPTPDQSSSPVSLQPSTGIRAGGQHLEGFSPNYFSPGAMPALTSTAGTTRDSGLVHILPSNTPDWFNNTTASAGDGSSGQYGSYGGATDGGLYYGTPNHSSSHFDLGAGGGGGAMPNCFDSSSSTYPMNSSSPNTMFGSFSSSVEFGTPGNMDVDMDMDMDIGLTNQFIHSSSSLADAMASGEFFEVEPSTQRRNIMNNNAPTPMFPTSPNPGTTMEPHTQTTVSPSMLRLDNSSNNMPSLPITSSSESLSGSYSPFHMETETGTVMQGTANNTVPGSLILPSSDRPKTSSRKSQRGANSVSSSSNGNSNSSKWSRKALPDKAPIPQFILPNNGQTRRSETLIPDNSVSSPKSHSKKSKSKSKSKTPSQSQSQFHLAYTMDFTTTPASSSSAAAAATSAAADVASSNPPVPSMVRSAQDEFLVSSRLGGMKYSQIRKLGNFKEAESTLRGRFRTLVKPKEARVRNPQWQEIDDRLLKQAVPHFSKSTDNIPWKAVADYIYNNGGTYQFGYNTCHKRWNYLKETTQTGGEPVKRERTRHGKKEV